MEKKLRELISKFLQEYMGTGASGGNAGDGNSIVSPRIGGEICCDDEDEIEHYTDKNVGYGAMGNHTSGMEKNKGTFNRDPRGGMFELKKYIKKVLKEQAYGHATLTTQGLPNSSRATVPTDEYPFSARPKSRLPSIMQEEGASWGLEPRQIADSFTFEELEQLKKYKKISPEDYNGAVGYLQAWADQHPTFLPQRDLNTSSRQEIRNKYEMGSIKIIELIVEYELKDLNKMKDNALLAQDQYAGNDVDSDKFGNEFYDMEIPELDGYSLRDVEDAINFIQPSQPSYTYDQAIGRAPLPDGRYLDKDGNKTTVAPNKDAFTKSSNFDRNEPLNERSEEEINRDRIYHQKEIGKLDLETIEIQRDAAVSAAAATKAQGTQAISDQEMQLYDLNEQVRTKSKEYGDTKTQIIDLKTTFYEMPIDTEEEIEARKKILEQIYELKDKLISLKEEVSKLREDRNKMAKGIQQAVSAQTASPSVAKDFDQQIRDKRKEITQIGKAPTTETLLQQYEKERINVNLMEQMDFYNDVTRGSLQKFFEMFEHGNTNEEVIQHYAKNGITIPESFISKVKKQFESYKKLKLELGFSEQEAKDMKKSIVPKEEPKKLSTKIFKK